MLQKLVQPLISPSFFELMILEVCDRDTIADSLWECDVNQRTGR